MAEANSIGEPGAVVCERAHGVPRLRSKPRALPSRGMSRASPRERNTTRFRKTFPRLGGLTVYPFGTVGRITANNRRIIHFGLKCDSPPQSIGALPMTRFARE